jgi:hypothetical protein
MQLKTLSKTAILALACTTGALAPQTAQADTIGYNVNFGSLGALNGNSTYNLDFTLIPFGTPNSSTTVNIGNFNYGGGSGPSSLGPLTDVSTFEEVFSPFTAGSSLSFNILANYTPEAANPDVLTFGLFTGSLNFTQTSTTPTRGSATGDGMSYFTITFNGATPTINTYAGTSPAFAAPTITTTPEPATWAMMAMGLGALGLLGYKRKRNAEMVA